MDHATPPGGRNILPEAGRQMISSASPVRLATKASLQSARIVPLWRSGVTNLVPISRRMCRHHREGGCREPMRSRRWLEHAGCGLTAPDWASRDRASGKGECSGNIQRCLARPTPVLGQATALRAHSFLTAQVRGDHCPSRGSRLSGGQHSGRLRNTAQSYHPLRPTSGRRNTSPITAPNSQQQNKYSLA